MSAFAHADGKHQNDAPAPLIEIRDLDRSFGAGTGRVSVLRKTTLTIRPGTFTVIRGPSGVGKTTLLRILALLDQNFVGSFRYASRSVRSMSVGQRDEIRSRDIGFVFQEGRFLNHLSLGENICLPLHLRGEDPVMIAKRLKAVSTFVFRKEELDSGLLNISPSQASGGQRQRAALARAIIINPKLVLADEPTASLDADARQNVIDKLRELHTTGATIVVVSHDPAFFDYGDQRVLSHGQLRSLHSERASGAGDAAEPVAIGEGQNTISLGEPPPNKGGSGWAPRLKPAQLFNQALLTVVRRPLISALTFVSLLAGICQVAILTALLGGLDRTIDEAMADGSRLNRIEIRPRTLDLGSDIRFPFTAEIASLPGVSDVVLRRSTSLGILGQDGSVVPYQTIGLHESDPEFRALTFIEGTSQDFLRDNFQVVATPGFLSEAFSLGIETSTSAIDWSAALGRQITIIIPRFNRMGQKTGEERLNLTIAAVALSGEQGSELYISNTMVIAVDAIKRDRNNTITLPVTEARTSWTPGADIAQITGWPWEDFLHVYTEEIDGVLPTIGALVDIGYRPDAEIWDFLWVLDLKQAATQIALPVMALLVAVIVLVLITCIFVSARLRETELALCRVLGMARGDLITIELGSLAILSMLAVLTGLLGADALVHMLNAQFEAQAALLDRIPDSEMARVTDRLFASVWGAGPVILIATMILVLVAAFGPAIQVANTDPAKVFSRS